MKVTKKSAKEVFLYARAEIHSKPTLPPSTLTVRSFPTELINMGNSLRARKQMHILGRACGSILKFLIASFHPTYELKRVVGNDTGPSKGA